MSVFDILTLSKTRVEYVPRQRCSEPETGKRQIMRNHQHEWGSFKGGSLVEIHFVALNLLRITFADGGQRFLQRAREAFPYMS